MEARSDKSPRALTRPTAFVGDLLRARAELAPDAEATLRMAAMLGLDRLAPERQPGTHGAWSHLPPSDTSGGGVPVADDATPSTAPPARPASGSPGEVRTTWLRPAAAHGSIAPAWAATTAALPVPPASRPGTIAEQLLEPKSERALLGALLATWAGEGPPDFRRLLEDVARLKPMVEIPRRPIPTLRRGAHILLDVGPAMAPYRADGRRLVRRIKALLGVGVEEFQGCPGRGVGARAATWKPPAPGTTLVVVSEFGNGGPAFDLRRGSLHEWMAFVERARRAQLPCVGLTPFGPDRWQPELARAMTLVHWNRTTGVAAVRRARRGT